MLRRVLTAAIGLPILIAVIILGLPWLTLLVGAVALLGIFEFMDLARKRGLKPFTPLAVVWTLAFVGTGYFVASGDLERVALGYAFVAGLLASLLWAFFARVRRRPDEDNGDPKENVALEWGYTVGGAIYVGWFLSYVLLLRGLFHGWQWVMVMLIGTFATDTAAFLAGRAIGRHKMAPVLSPGKTWEGATAGMLGALIAVPLLAYGLGIDMAVWKGLALGALVGLFAQAGDMVESMLKRLSGAKDSGKILPGHGGFLDRLDSVVFNIVVVYYFAIWIS